jgi:glutamate-1-semialdehyde 2,1-aminomutase
MLSRAFTKRNLVLKIGGGWHGSQPYLLKGVTSYTKGLHLVESSGMPSSSTEETLTTRFNDVGHLEEAFEKFGEQIACFILEPFMGEGGFLFATEEYLNKARELTRDWGALLILDEIIAGFRFCPSSLASLYGVQPDLSTFGKIFGGGMPLTAVAGRGDVLELANSRQGHPRQVKFEGGTYSGHPASILAAITLLDYLKEHEQEIYPEIHRLGERARSQIPGVFEKVGIRAVVTGGPSGPITQSSMGMIHFPVGEDTAVSVPEIVWNPKACDVVLREKILRVALANEGFHVVHGFGSLSSRHTEAEVDDFLSAVELVAALFAGCT